MTGFTEDELIQEIRRILSGEASGVLLGPGDDAALVEAGGGLVVLTTDFLVEGVHFDRGTFSPRDLGYKALTASVSDVAAMAGSPRYALVGLGLPPDAEAAWVVELYGGLREAAGEYAVVVVGGDLSRSDRVVLAVTVTGEVARGRAVSRSGARPGDRVVVTGVLGAAAGGLHIARADRRLVNEALTSNWGRELLRAHFRPVARVGEGQTLAQAGATAMMDVSDGLAIDLGRLCRESGAAAAVRLADVPVAPGLELLAKVMNDLDLDPLDLALGGGEDFELMATIPRDSVEPAGQALRERFGTPLTEIGEIREGSGLIAVGEDGSERDLEPKGWDHFAEQAD
jgi:thiamine-monophosphate kinase